MASIFPANWLKLRMSKLMVKLNHRSPNQNFEVPVDLLKLKLRLTFTANLQPSMVTLLTIHRQKTVLQGARAFGREDIHNKHGFGDCYQTSNMKGSLFEHESLKASKKSRKQWF